MSTFCIIILQTNQKQDRNNNKVELTFRFCCCWSIARKYYCLQQRFFLFKIVRSVPFIRAEMEKEEARLNRMLGVSNAAVVVGEEANHRKPPPIVLHRPSFKPKGRSVPFNLNGCGCESMSARFPSASVPLLLKPVRKMDHFFSSSSSPHLVSLCFFSAEQAFLDGETEEQMIARKRSQLERAYSKKKEKEEHSWKVKQEEKNSASSQSHLSSLTGPQATLNVKVPDYYPIVIPFFCFSI